MIKMEKTKKVVLLEIACLVIMVILTLINFNLLYQDIETEENGFKCTSEGFMYYDDVENQMTIPYWNFNEHFCNGEQK